MCHLASSGSQSILLRIFISTSNSVWIILRNNWDPNLKAYVKVARKSRTKVGEGTLHIQNHQNNLGRERRGACWVAGVW